jgi:arsenate reductase
MYTKIEQLIQKLDVNTISKERKTILKSLVEFIQNKVDANQKVDINFICTHNSRRSHLSQVWAQVLSAHFEIPKVFTYSGGTIATAMFPKVVETLRVQGLEIFPLSEGDNPIYGIKYAKNAHPDIGFSKTYDHTFNPTSQFATIMTCSHADAECPFIT